MQATRGAIVPASFFARSGVPDPTVDLVDWSGLKTALAERGLLTPDAVFAAPIWLYAGKVSYALGPDSRVVCACGDQQNFPYRYDQTAWAGRDAIVISVAGHEDWWQFAQPYFDTLEDLPPVVLTRAGEPVLTLELKRGTNLHFP